MGVLTHDTEKAGFGKMPPARFWALGMVMSLALTLGGCSTVGRKLLLPPLLQGQVAAVLPPDSAYELVPLQTRDVTRITVLFGRADSPEGDFGSAADHAPTMIFSYGSCPHIHVGAWKDDRPYQIRWDLSSGKSG